MTSYDDVVRERVVAFAAVDASHGFVHIVARDNSNAAIGRPEPVARTLAQADIDGEMLPARIWPRNCLSDMYRRAAACSAVSRLAEPDCSAGRLIRSPSPVRNSGVEGKPFQFT